jgi:long-subunit fatty acid transport protein
MRFSWVLVTLLGVMSAASTVSAGGFDTPILYSARHIGMGGTAVAYVDDASAGFHNPAGFGAIGKANLMVNASPILGSLQSSPDRNVAGDPINVTSDTTFAPFFLAGGAVRVWDYISLGFTVFPVASAGATYNYSTDPDDPEGSAVRDYTKLVFLEFAPGIGFNYDKWGLRVGATWRINTVQLDREKTGVLDLHLKGASLAGYRLGVQWDVPWVEGLSFGLHYRSRIDIRANLTDAPQQASILVPTQAHQDWTLPSRLSFGASHKVGPMRVAADAEFGFQSQNQRGDIVVTEDEAGLLDFIAPATLAAATANVYAWKNQWTLRGGIEYGVAEDRVPIRVGFIWDQRTSNPSYPSAFGAPPASNYSLTAGTGYRANGHRFNFAAVYRWGRGEVSQRNIDNPNPDLGPCAFCAQPGEYIIRMAGIYLDYSYDF